MRKLFTSRLFRCVVCLILVCALLVSWSPIRARAMAGGGVIGGASAAGLALSSGMVGLLLLAAFGVYYAYNDATTETLGYDLEELLEAEVTNAQLSTQQSAEYAAALTSWWESAKAGAIDLVSAPTWIQDVITGWASDFISGSSTILGPDPSICVGVGEFTVPHSYISSSSGELRTFSTSITSTEPVYYQTFCKGGYHYTYFFSSAAFSGVSPIKKTVVNGKTIYFSPNSMSGTGFTMRPSATCNVVSEIPNIDDLISTYSRILANGPETVPIAPDVITGGISDQLSSGIGMDVIGLPDIVIPGPDVLPVNPSEGQTTAQAVTDYLMAALIAGEITWEQYWQLIGVYNPAIGSSVPTVGTVDPVTGTITNTEISTGVVVTPSPIQNFHLDLRSFFPFCIPFDFYEFIRILCAEPEAPVFHWEVQDLSGNVYSVDVDLSPWNPHAQLFRDAQCLLFIIGLLMLTRKFIKW